MNDSTESVPKHKKRNKVKKTKKSKSSDIEWNSESQAEEETNNYTDNDDVVQVTTEVKTEPSPSKQKRHSRRKSNSQKGDGRNLYPHTIITAVLEELDEDMVDEPPRGDGGGEGTTVESVVQAPISLPPDKVYVERKNGFVTTPRAKLFQSSSSVENGGHDGYSKSLATPLELAIFIQKCFRPVYTLCHGLLGGMAIMHLIMVYGVGDYYYEEKNFVFMYTSYARIYQSLFQILSILCFISIMDRCDIQHMDVNQLVDLFRFNFSTVLVLSIYFVTVILTFVTTKWDDWLALSSYNEFSEYIKDANKLPVWKSLNLCRSIGAISGWILIALFPAEDMLHLHLCNMMKYQPINTRAVPSRY